MESIYLILIVILFLLAISDLVVGVSNDAVNFLNSAIGSKAASFRVIMIVAALGILFGATFSSGMMEVARKGIFNPQHFYFSEIIIIFLAVMITDVILLDLFNTFGLPTSTTVSIVFELLGAAVAVSLIKITQNPDSLPLSSYINSAKALAIIAGILLSVVVAFSVGAIIQYLSRLLFSFDYEKKLKHWGSLWGGFAITAITYFILIKGAKGSSFMSEETKDFIHNNSLAIVGISFVVWTIVLQILSWLFKLNILKLIVLVGTFALAMAFAGNDLVNFIGVPLAGLESYKEFIAHPDAQPDNFLMVALTGKIKTPTLFLLIAGLIMVITLWLSKKAKSVVKTSLDLGRQNEGFERFDATGFSRVLVRSSSNAANFFEKLLPKRLNEKIKKNFDQTVFTKNQKKLGNDAPAFDMIRASVTLVVASILIAFGTSLKLPLSTTYVTFMVAMGTSLADRAWGRESAVYRISGVLSVIGGWFFTALAAFTAAFVLAYLISYGGFIAIIALVLFAAFIIYRTHIIHKEKVAEEKNDVEIDNEELTNESLVVKSSNNVVNVLVNAGELIEKIFNALANEDLKKLRKINKEVDKINKKTKKSRDNVEKIIRQLEESSVESGHYYVQVLDYLREIAHTITFIARPCLEHVDNNHKGLLPDQVTELERIQKEMNKLVKMLTKDINDKDYSNLQDILEQQQLILNTIDETTKNQIKRIKANVVGTKNSLLYLNILAESKNLILYAVNVLKSHRDFVNDMNGSDIENEDS